MSNGDGRSRFRRSIKKVIHERIKKIGGDGGLIAIDKNGHIEMPFNTEGMYRGCWSNDGLEKIEIY